MMVSSPASMDRIVEGYLTAVARACAGLPASRVEELVNDLREHIAVARAALPDPTEADIRTILDRLGDPAAIAAEAYRYEPTQPRVVQPARRTAAPRTTAPRTTAPRWRSTVGWAFGLVAFLVLVGVVLVLLQTVDQ